MYIRSPNARVLVRNGKVVLCNTRNGSFVKAPQVYYDYLEMYLKENNGHFVENEEDIVVRNAYSLFQELCRIRFFVPKEKLKEEETYPYHVIYLSLTNRCNLQCKHCIVSAGIEENDHMSTDDWKRVIDQVVTLKPEQINLTGGEPLIRSDFCEILEYLRENYNGVITLSTNGLLLNDALIRVIKRNVDGISISLDGFDSYSCIKVRGADIFDRVVTIIRKLKKSGIEKISVSMLETSYTYGYDQKFHNLCEELGVKALIRRFTPTGRGEENQRELLPPMEYIKRMKKQHLQCKLCQPGKKELSVGENGDVYPCLPLSGDASLLMGNLLEDSIEEILNDTRWRKAIEELRPWRMKKCGECDVNLFCHSCINFIQGMQSDEEVFEKFCSQQRKHLENLLWEVSYE